MPWAFLSQPFRLKSGHLVPPSHYCAKGTTLPSVVPEEAYVLSSELLLHLKQFVPDISLPRDVTRFADRLFDLFEREVIDGAGLGDDVFFDH